MCCQNLLYRFYRISNEIMVEIQNDAGGGMGHDALEGWDEQL